MYGLCPLACRTRGHGTTEWFTYESLIIHELFYDDMKRAVENEWSFLSLFLSSRVHRYALFLCLLCVCAFFSIIFSPLLFARLLCLFCIKCCARTHTYGETCKCMLRTLWQFVFFAQGIFFVEATHTENIIMCTTRHSLVSLFQRKRVTRGSYDVHAACLIGPGGAEGNKKIQEDACRILG